MKESTKQALMKALFEATFVVFGVMVALLANNWWTHRSDLARADSALESIVQELQANRDALQASADYHGELVAMIDGARAPDSKAITAADFPRGFIMPAKLLDTAWTAAAETDALRHLDFEVVQQCSALYAEADYYSEQLVLASGPLYADLYELGARRIASEKTNSIYSIIVSFLYRERQLVDAFSTALDDLAAAP